MTKTEIRKQMKGLNTALSSEQREELSARIFNEAERLPAFARAKVVALFASLKDEPRPDARTLEPLQTDRTAPRGRRHNAILRLRSRLDERLRLVRHFGTRGHCAMPPRGDRFYHRAGCGVHRRRHAPGTRQGILRQIPVAAGFPGFQGRRVLSASGRGGAARRSIRRSGRSPLLRTVKRVPTLVPQSNPTVPTCSPNRRRTPSGFRHRKPANTGYGKES